MTLRFRLLAAHYAVVRLAPDTPVPPWAWSGELASATRTPHELSVVCLESAVPPEERAERGWRVLELQGPIPFTETGIAAAFTTALAVEGIGVFVLSTFDTDYLLVKTGDLDRTVAALRERSIEVEG